MNRILVIADDLTGAAEIAGIGRRFGFAARLYREAIAPPPAAGLCVYDTDSRGLAPVDAASRVASFAAAAAREHFDLAYKKCDSVLRGPVAAEITAMMGALRLKSSILLPQNPSRGRTIDADGVYRLHGVPIDQTEFASDPDDPAHTAVAVELLARRSSGAISSAVRLRHAAHPQDVTAAAAGVVASVLPAGGADFFHALLRAGGKTESQPPPAVELDTPTMLLSGSGSRQTSETIARAIEDGDAVSRMPPELFSTGQADATRLERWADEVAALLASRPRVLVAIDQPVTRNRQLSARLTEVLADLVALVLSRGVKIGSLLLEGGATASAVCRRMIWNRFDVVAELAPGVVSLAPQWDKPAPVLILKPGSYTWPAAAWPGGAA